MNARIKALAQQAKKYADEQNELYGVDFNTEYNAKFAELIVKDVFAMLKESCIAGDEGTLADFIDDRLGDAASDVVDAYDIADRIY